MRRLFDLATAQATERPGGIMLGAKVNSVWQTWTCKEVVQQAESFAEGLLTLSIRNQVLEPEQQEKIAMVSHNRPEWVIADLAVQQAGAILLPIYPTINPIEFTYIMNQAEARIAIFSDKEMYDRFQPAFADIPTLEHVLTFEEVEGAIHWKSLKSNAQLQVKRKEICETIMPSTIATIIYTSGTTGTPKGVMLSHSNIVSNVMDSKFVFHFVKTDDRSLSFLPLNHIFERMIIYVSIHLGINVYFAENLNTIGENLKEIQPTVFTCVPRLLEKVYEKIVATGMAQKGIKRSLFFWALNLGKKYDNINRGNGWYRLQLAVANKLVFSKLRDALGGKVKAVVSGSAPLQEMLIRIFSAGKITIMEGYGLTETSPVISVNRLESAERRIGTVGPPIKNVEIKIAEDGEIICRGPNIMQGYYKDPEQTADVIDAEGWLHTGDIGVLQEGRFLKITDRKKEMFKTSGGKYVAPQVIENKLRESPYIEQMMVVGPNRKFVSALIVPSFNQIIKKLESEGETLPHDKEEFVKHPKVISLIQSQVDKYNAQLNHIEQVKKFTLLPEEWTVENGILTPKLSLRRKEVNQKYADIIDALYL